MHYSIFDWLKNNANKQNDSIDRTLHFCWTFSTVKVRKQIFTKLACGKPVNNLIISLNYYAFYVYTIRRIGI